MQYRTLGQTGMNISAVVYGGIVSMDAQQKDSDGYVEWALSQGINYFDVAPSYGCADEAGQLAGPVPRQGVSGLQD